MRQFLFTLLSLCVLAAIAPATVVTFDDLEGQAAVPDGYGGINWGGAWTYYGFEQFPYTPHSGANRVYTPGTGAGEYTFSFVTPGQAFDGAWFSGQARTTLKFNLYDDGSLVWTSATLNTSDVPTFLASGYSGLVDVVGVWASDNDFYVMDDVTYGGGQVVPEPGTVLLLASGVGALAILRRRR